MDCSLDARSAGFLLVDTKFQLVEGKHFNVSFTLRPTNRVNFRTWFFRYPSTIWLSEYRKNLEESMFNLAATDLVAVAKSSAAHSSRRGIDSVDFGAILELPVTKDT